MQKKRQWNLKCEEDCLDSILKHSMLELPTVHFEPAVVATAGHALKNDLFPVHESRERLLQNRRFICENPKGELSHTPWGPNPRPQG